MRWLKALLVLLLVPFAAPLVLQVTDRGDKAAATPGGRTVAHKAGGQRVALRGPIPRVEAFGLGLRAGEPTLGVTKNGDIFYAAFQDSTRVEIMRSRNGGRKWDVVSPKFRAGVNAHLLSLDPYLYVDPATDRIFTIDLTVACSYLSFSDNHGRSWTTNPLACGRPVNDHQTLFAGPPVTSPTVAYPNIVYYCFQDLLTSSCSKSLDGGLTYTPTGAPAFWPGAESCVDGGLHGHGVVGADGAVYLPKEHCDQPFLAISKDEGATWRRVQVADNGAQLDPTVDVDSNGNIYYAWIAKDLRPYLSVSRDGGKRWTKPIMIGVPGLLRSNLMTLDAGAPGKVAFLYMGTEDRRPPTTWNGYVGMTVQALTRDPLFYTGRANVESDPLKRGGCGPGRCGEQVLDFLDVVIAPDGSVWGSFVDVCDVTCAQTGFAGGHEGIATHVIGGPRLR
jgi:hypothetical protein